MNARPPIVVVVGHVDHGKTSLLDAIRKTSVTKKEAGGITQSIGASIVKSEDKDICFIDTPGHAFFSAMRSRGITIADLAILVVAADDGAKPQTLEVIKLLQSSKIPFIVALTKIDLPSANIENALQSLEKEGVYFEKRGGEVPYIGVSSKTGAGLKELLELIHIVSQVYEIQGSNKGELEGFVIETSKDKKGQLVSVVLKNGSIKIGDEIYANKIKAKVKGLFNDNQKPIKEVGAGYPAQILGFNELPEIGAKIASSPSETSKEISNTKVTVEPKLKIFVKAKTAGSLEALIANLPNEVQVIGSGVGDVIESDIFLAKAANAPIFLFEAKFSPSIKKLAVTEGVQINRFNIVYDLIEKLKELLIKDREVIEGSAQIIASFPFEKKQVAGCKIIKGEIKKTSQLKLMRNGVEIGKVKVVSIRKQKEEVSSVRQGEECGILFEPNLDFVSGDMLLSVSKQ